MIRFDELKVELKIWLQIFLKYKSFIRKLEAIYLAKLCKKFFDLLKRTLEN